MGRLDGRVAMITGAGRGMGRAAAHLFAAEGAAVVIAEVNAETGARVEREVLDAGGRARSAEIRSPASGQRGSPSRPGC